MQDFMKIKADSRQQTGKQVAKKLRAQGKIPAIIYGDQKDPIPVSLNLSDVKAILKTTKGENTVLNIHRDDIEVIAMLKEFQYDYLGDNIIHADFIRINLEKPVHVSVPVHLHGESIGVREDDCFMDFVTREIKVKCLPTHIPIEYVLDVTNMRAGDFVKAEDMDLGEGIELENEPSTMIVSVAHRAGSDLDEDVEEEVAEEVAEEAPVEK